MKIGIIIHSFTGNTYAIAEKLRDKITASGHTAVIDKVRAVGETLQTFKDFQLEKAPDASQYDALIFGAPVRAFSLSPVMKAYLNQLSGSGTGKKKSACFVTQAFPFAWMGGNQAISQFKQICRSRGIEVSGTGIVNWSNKKRDKQIENLVNTLSGLF